MTWGTLLFLLIFCAAIGKIAHYSATEYRESKAADLQYVATVFDTSLPQVMATVTGHDTESSGFAKSSRRTYCAEFTINQEETLIVKGPSGTFSDESLCRSNSSEIPVGGTIPVVFSPDSLNYVVQDPSIPEILNVKQLDNLQLSIGLALFCLLLSSVIPLSVVILIKKRARRREPAFIGTLFLVGAVFAVLVSLPFSARLGELKPVLAEYEENFTQIDQLLNEQTTALPDFNIVDAKQVDNVPMIDYAAPVLSLTVGDQLRLTDPTRWCPVMELVNPAPGDPKVIVDTYGCPANKAWDFESETISLFKLKHDDTYAVANISVLNDLKDQVEGVQLQLWISYAFGLGFLLLATWGYFFNKPGPSIMEKTIDIRQLSIPGQMQAGFGSVTRGRALTQLFGASWLFVFGSVVYGIGQQSQSILLSAFGGLLALGALFLLNWWNNKSLIPARGYRRFRELYHRSAEAGGSADFLASFPAIFQRSVAEAQQNRGSFNLNAQLKFLMYANLGAFFVALMTVLWILGTFPSSQFSVVGMFLLSVSLVSISAVIVVAIFQMGNLGHELHIRARVVDNLAQEFAIHHSEQFESQTYQFETNPPIQPRAPHTFAPPHVTAQATPPAGAAHPVGPTYPPAGPTYPPAGPTPPPVTQRWYPL